MKIFINRPIHVECIIYNNTLPSAMDGEVVAIFVHCQTGILAWHTLLEMVHSQELIEV